MKLDCLIIDLYSLNGVDISVCLWSKVIILCFLTPCVNVKLEGPLHLFSGRIKYHLTAYRR